ncbi:MAG: FRG domain-containing protein [Dethiobacteria bacterium]
MENGPEIIEITSAYDFFKTVHHKNKQRLNNGERSFIQYFRGQSNCEWGVTPLIHRAPEFTLFEYEKEMVEDFISRRPAEFKDIENSFNLIAKMQHYGLATRLIDMTTNPAVSLFFVCYHHFDRDGEVYLFNTVQEDILSPRVLNMIVEFYLNEKESGYNLLSYYRLCAGRYHQEEIRKGFFFLVNNSPMAAITERVSERMIRQSSMFIIVPFHAENKDNNPDDLKHLFLDRQWTGLEKYIENTSITPRIDDIRDYLLKYHQDGRRFIVKAENKQEILRELKTIGIYEALIFPELEYEGKGIVNEYLNLTEQTTI